ncbi:MAG: hypothetical protein IJ446_07525 [Oscillospiraceae bacterium]|nr:hypothetical protein [Oscillospiraceae bacterium]
MTVSEFLKDYSRSERVCGRDMVLAVNVNNLGGYGGYHVIMGGAVEIKCGIVSETAKKKYVLSGHSFLRRGAARRFTVIMDRVIGDPFQEAVLDRSCMLGTGNACIMDYVYFCAADGKGEKGRVTVDVVYDFDGSADMEDIICIELYGYGETEDYSYNG